MGGRERANLTRPPSQVDRCHPVSVHYDSTSSAPEFSFQSFVRLESLPASRTSHTRTSGLTPRQSNNWKTSPSSLVLYLPLNFPEAPPVHPTPIPSTLTVTLPVETAYSSNIFQYYCLSPLDCDRDDRFCSTMKQMSNPCRSASSILRRYDPPSPSVV